MEYQFKEGDRVKLKPLDTLKKYFARGRFSLSRGSKHLLKTIEDGWYTPIEQDYDRLIKLNFKVDHHLIHHVMDTCYIVVADTGECNRYPEGWMEKVE
jgi:hypothetical protein